MGKKRKKRLKRGNGEFLLFSIVAVILSIMFVYYVGFMQFSMASRSISKSAVETARAAAICTSQEAAEEAVERMADATVSDIFVYDIKANVENISLENEGDDWKSGDVLKVTVSGNIDTISPDINFLGEEVNLFQDQTYSKSQLVVFEGTGLNALFSVTINDSRPQAMDFMGWQLITAESAQLKLRMKYQNFDSNGFGRIGEYYVVACTSTFGKIGDRLAFHMSDGSTIYAVMGDEKSSNDKNWCMYGHQEGLIAGTTDQYSTLKVIEFIVDYDTWYNPLRSHIPSSWQRLRVLSVDNLGPIDSDFS